MLIGEQAFPVKEINELTSHRFANYARWSTSLSDEGDEKTCHLP